MDKLKNTQFDWPFFGNKHIIEFLQASIINDKLANCYIYAGLPDVGKSTVAKHFSASCLCENFAELTKSIPCRECVSCRQVYNSVHSDLTILKRETDKKNLSVEQVRGFIHTMQLGSFGGRYKIGIIKEADLLSEQAANALLKTLEEPRKNVVIILLASSIERLLPTICSRAEILNFRPVATSAIGAYLEQDHGAAKDIARRLSHLSIGRPARATKLLADTEFLAKTNDTNSKLLQILIGSSCEKLSYCDELLTGYTGDELRQRAEEVIVAWQLLVRDALLLTYGLEGRVSNTILVDALKNMSISIQTLIYLNEQLEQAKRYLTSSLSPRLAVESLCYL